MTIEIVPFEAGLGAEIRGVDIREPLSAADRDAIRAAWLEHLVLRFRGQPMSDAQHMAFTRQFGELEFNPAALIAKQYGVETQTAGRRREIPPEISVISNIVEDGKAIGGLGDGEAFWHTDSSFVDVPPAASLLRSLEVPPPSAGGSTYFLNMYAAYETLPEETQAPDRRPDDDPCRDPFERRQGASRGSRPSPTCRRCRARTSRWCGPIPRPGRKALVSRPPHQRLCPRAVGRRQRDSCSTLLWEHATQEKFTWRQDWRVGDLIWWDNRCAMHRRDAFDPSARRLMHRTQLKGTRPV